jgi:hypothetical protein
MHSYVPTPSLWGCIEVAGLHAVFCRPAEHCRPPCAAHHLGCWAPLDTRRCWYAFTAHVLLVGRHHSDCGDLRCHNILRRSSYAYVVGAQMLYPAKPCGRAMHGGGGEVHALVSPGVQSQKRRYRA